MKYLSLSIAALIPVVLLCWYIYMKDHKEKEPLGLLVILFGVGAFLFFPVIFIENIMIDVVDNMMLSQMKIDLGGVAGFITKKAHIQHSLLCGFFAVALVEEGMIWFVLFLITHKNKNYDHLFDGVVYAVFLTMGFAAMENIYYALRDGWGIFVLRTLSSVPGHMIFGVFMGFCYTMWRTKLIAENLEKHYEADGIIKIEKPYRSRLWLIGSILLPVILHGIYSFIKFYSSDILSVGFYIYIVGLCISCMVVVHNLSDSDMEEDKMAYRMLVKKYPSLRMQIMNLKN